MKLKGNYPYEQKSSVYVRFHNSELKSRFSLLYLCDILIDSVGYFQRKYRIERKMKSIPRVLRHFLHIMSGKKKDQYRRLTCPFKENASVAEQKLTLESARINLHLTLKASRTRQTSSQENYPTHVYLYVHVIHKFNIRINPRAWILRKRVEKIITRFKAFSIEIESERTLENTVNLSHLLEPLMAYIQYTYSIERYYVWNW